MQQVSLKATTRENFTKGFNRRFRMAGEVPAVIYGGNEQPQSVTVNDREMHKIRKMGANVFINLEFTDASKKQMVLVKSIQREPVGGAFIHIDFFRISMDKELTTNVPVEVSGIAAGIQDGGILSYNMREIEVHCLPNLIPDKIIIDVTPLKINDSIHIRDLVVADGIKLGHDPEQVVLKISPPMAEEVVAATTEEVLEPEVIEKGKKEEEGEEGAAGEGEAKAEKGKSEKTEEKKEEKKPEKK